MVDLEEGREVLSYSSINAMRMCGMLYYWKYVAGMKEEYNDSLLLGSCFHFAVGEAMKEKIANGSYDVDTFVAVARTKFEDMMKLNINFRKGKTASGVLDDIERAVTEYLYWAERNVEPVFAEKKLNFTIAGREMVCYIDLVDAKGTIIDLKTKGKSPSKDEAKESIQLAIYAEAMKQNNLTVNSTRLDFVVMRKDFVEIMNVESKHPLNRKDYLNNIVRYFTKLEENKIYMPTISTNWKCSIQYCSFYKLCSKKGVV